MSHVIWGAVEHDDPIVVVQHSSSTHRHQRSLSKSRSRGLRRLPSMIVLALVVMTSSLALFDLYLLVSSGFH
jgi:hypothetical protein